MEQDNRFGYKAFNHDFSCRGKQYEGNTTYEESGGEICGAGMMHYCVNPFECLNYYPLIDDDGDTMEFSRVEAQDDVPISDDGKKFATKKLHIGARIGIPGFVKACIDYSKTWANNAKSVSTDSAQMASSGYYAQMASSGNSVQMASSGDSAQMASSGYSARMASSGYSARMASSGDSARMASSGYSAQMASSGDYARMASSGYSARMASSGYSARMASSGDSARMASSGDSAVVMAAGRNSIAKATVGSWITLAEWEYDDSKNTYIPICVKTEFVDGNNIKEDTWYKLVDGKFIEVDSNDNAMQEL